MPKFRSRTKIFERTVESTKLAEDQTTSMSDSVRKNFQLKKIIEYILPVIIDKLNDEEIQYKRHAVFVTRISEFVCECIREREVYKLTYREVRLWLRWTISILMKIEKKRAIANRYLMAGRLEPKIDSLIEILRLCFDRKNNILPAYQALIATRAEIHHELEVPEVSSQRGKVTKK